METFNVNVRCTVDNCHYWAEGRGCVASEILVTSDNVGAREGEDIDAPVAGVVDLTPAEKCMDTCCKTFIKKTSGKKKMDDVSRR